MKKFIPLIIIIIGVMLSSCKKDEINNTDTKVGISDVTFYPVVTIKGDQYMAVPLNSTFTDPGAEAKEAGATTQYTKTGNVNTATTGVYRITYTAVNKDGFPASVSRWVAVYSTDPTATGNDFSGSYLRAATGVTSTWTKLAPGVYKVDNPGGATSGTGLSIIVFNPTGLTIHAPTQIANDGTESSTSNEVYTLTPAPAQYTWKFNNPGYGTGMRIFVKQ
jgi:hypothetical protein